MAEEIRIPARIDTKKALNDIRSFANRTRSAVKSISDSFLNLKTLAAGAVAFLGARGVVRGIKSITDAAARQEDAINDLNIALKASGQFSEEASKDFQRFASSLQETSKFGDELILENAALIQSLGRLDQEGLKQATQAAADLSAALKIDLRSAATLVGKAAAGEISSFSRYGVIIKKGADNAETFSNALAALNKNFGGAAAAQINTFSGATEQLSNTFGDLFEEVGFLITRNKAIISSVKSLNSVFKDLINIVSENSDEITDGLNKAFKQSLLVLADVIDVSDDLAKAFGIIADATPFSKLLDVFKSFNIEGPKTEGTIKNIAIGIVNLGKSVLQIIELLQIVPNTIADFIGLPRITEVLGIEEAAEKLDILGSKLAGLEKAAPDQVFPGRDGILDNDELDKNISKTDELADRIRNLANEIKDIPKDLDVNIKPTGSGAAGGSPEQQPGTAQTPDFDFGFLVNSAITAGNFIKDSAAAFAQTFENLATGFITASLDGAEGATKLLATAGSEAIGDAFGPAAGKAAGPIIEAFAKGPEFVESQVNAFVDALPVILENFAKSAPVFVRAIVDNLDEIIIALVEAIPDIAQAIAIEVPLALSDPALWERVALALFDAVKDAVSFRIGELREQFAQFSVGLNESFQSVIGFFQNDIPREIANAFSGGLRDGFAQLDFSTLIDFGAIKDGFLSIIPDFAQDAATQFGDSLVDQATRFIDQIVEEIEGAIDAATGGLSSGNLSIGGSRGISIGSGGVSVGGVGIGGGGGSTGLGFAEGGVVPPGFPNDTFPAPGLTSGEEVVTERGRTDFAGAVDANSAMLARLMEAVNRLASNSVVLDLDQQALENSILTLNRRNARLTA